MIGEIVVFIEDFEFNNKVYKKGHQFKITGVDGMRGYDLEDKDGNRIGLSKAERWQATGETRFISDKYMLLRDLRDDKLKELGL